MSNNNYDKPLEEFNVVPKVYIEKEAKFLTLKSFKTDVKIIGTVAEVCFEQIFKNPFSNKDVEISYQVPFSDTIVISKMAAQIGDRQVDLSLKGKEEAKEKFEDAAANQKTAVLGNMKEDNDKMLDIKIGALKPDQEVKIALTFYDLVKVENSMFTYKFGSYKQYEDPDFLVELNVAIKMANPLTHFTCPKFIQTETDGGDKTQIKASFKGKIRDQNLSNLAIQFVTADIEEPELLFQVSEDHPDEVAVLFSAAPSFVVKKKPENPQDIIVSDKQVAKGKKEYLDAEGGRFLFLVDRSGSMSCGPRMPLTREAMILFMRSLPVGSQYQIISYGSQHKYYNGQAELVDYTDENMEAAIADIATYNADMGGNEELTPLKAAIDLLKKDDKGHVKNIFLLTDGGVGVGGQCTIPQLLQFGRDNKDVAAIHTIGVGSGVELDFCHNIAKETDGKCLIVTENDMKNDEMSGLIVNALEQAAQVGLQEANVDITEAASVKFKHPACPQFQPESKVFRSMAVMKRADFENAKFNFNFKNPREGYEKTEMNYTFSDFKQVEGDGIFKMAASNYLKQKDATDKKKTSLEYGVLSSETAFIGVVKSSGPKTTEEPETIDVEIVSKNKYQDKPRNNVYGGTMKMKKSIGACRGVPAGSLGMATGSAMLPEMNYSRAAPAPAMKAKARKMAPAMNSKPLAKPASKSGGGFMNSIKGIFGSSAPKPEAQAARKRTSYKAAPEFEKNSMKMEMCMDAAMDDYMEEDCSKLSLGEVGMAAAPSMAMMSAAAPDDDLEARLNALRGVDSYTTKENSSMNKMSSMPSSGAQKMKKQQKVAKQSVSSYKSIVDMFDNAGKMTNDIFIATFLRKTIGKTEMFQALDDEVWWTVLALVVLELKFKDKEADWKLVARKAYSYLKKQKIDAEVVEQTKKLVAIR